MLKLAVNNHEKKKTNSEKSGSGSDFPTFVETGVRKEDHRFTPRLHVDDAATHFHSYSCDASGEIEEHLRCINALLAAKRHSQTFPITNHEIEFHWH